MKTLLICLTILLGSLLTAEQINQSSLTHKEKEDLALTETKKVEQAASYALEQLALKAVKSKEEEEVVNLAKGLTLDQVLNLPRKQKDIVLANYAHQFAQLAGVVVIVLVFLLIIVPSINKLGAWIGEKESSSH